MIVNYADRYMDDSIALWNTTAVKDDYKELTRERFRDIFINNPYFDPKGAFILIEREAVTGFACGCIGRDLPLGEKAGYITCIVLAQKSRNQQNFSLLLEQLEQYFIQNGKQQAEVLFFNPMLLPWYIPNTQKHEHNNAPGAPVGSYYHTFLLQDGYAERARECAMYLDLNNFSITDYMKKKEQESVRDGYEVALFDVSRHFGMEKMLNGFDNLLWQKEIPACIRSGVPVVVAAKQNEVVGFAGPVIRQPTGRGYFSGIGVHPEHEGHGLGSVLFFKLCEAFQEIRTDYMSLYTGVENPAMRIYQHAGFIPVKEFAVMRKEFKNE
jgi:Acetyltransferases